MCIDLGNGGAFAEGQTYVALSRVKTMSGVHLARPLSLSDVQTNPRIQAFLVTGERPRPMEQRRDIESVKKFWRDVFPEFSAADSVYRCANPHHIYKLNGQPRFWGACYWFSCPYAELSKTIFLICLDNRNRSSVIFKIPTYTFGENVFDLDLSIRSNDGRHQNQEYRDAYFDLFLETAGHYMELRTEINFDSYMIASETNWEVRNLKDDSEEE